MAGSAGIYLARDRNVSDRWVVLKGLLWPADAPGWDGKILGQRPVERELRLGLERTYRALAHLANRADDRIALVERANSVRPRTLI